MAEAKVSDTWERGNAYEKYVGRWSRQVAPAFLAWLQVPVGRRWQVLDAALESGDHHAPKHSRPGLVRR